MSATSLAALFSEDARKRFARVVEPVRKEEDLDTASASSQPEEETESENDENDDEEMDEDSEERTIFVGSIPVTESKKSIEKLFSQFGAIESVRLRSVPFQGVKVVEAGNQRLVKKVCANQKKFGDQKGSCNAYVKFKEVDSVEQALTLNNFVLGGRHLRVDASAKSVLDHQKSIFIGGVPYYADEEELRVYFAKVLPNGQDDIIAVRLIRDPQTLIGKGFGYILFKDRAAVIKSLELNKGLFKEKWALRVTTCSPKKSKKNPAKSKGQQAPKKLSETAAHALKRIKRQGVNTKKKLMQGRSKTSKAQKSSRKSK